MNVSSILDSGRVVAVDIKLSHSVFALPFAVLGAVLAGSDDRGTVDSWSSFALQLGLVVVAMVFARTVAMLANRMLDARLDARNPRTAGRAIPSGRLSINAARLWAAAAGAGFMMTCGGFWWLEQNPWPLVLGLPVLAWISAYGLFKRFTSLCHIWLGTSLAISPIAAAIAIEPMALGQTPALWAIAAMVLGWVAGFDVIYALQDVDVDRRDGLFSMPSRLGPRRAMWVSRGLHAAAFAALAFAWSTEPRFGTAFGVAVALTGLLLLIEHATVHRWGTSRISLTFFTLNGVISVVLGVAGVADILLGAG